MRSNENIQALVPDPALIAASSPATQSRFFAHTENLAPNATVLQAAQICTGLENLGTDPCGGAAKSWPMHILRLDCAYVRSGELRGATRLRRRISTEYLQSGLAASTTI